MNILIASLLIANLVTILSVSKTIIKEEVKLNKKISEIDKKNLELLRKINFVENEIGYTLEVIAKTNIDKLEEGYLAGYFRVEDSVNRNE